MRAGYGIAFDPLSTFEVTAVAGKIPGLTTSCSATVGGAVTPGCASVPDVRIAQGFPTELAPPSVQPSTFLTLPNQLLSNAPALTMFDQNYKVPTVHEWNLTVQHELPGGVVAQVGYVGRRGLRLQRAYDLNQINADGILPSFLAMQQNFNNGCQPDGTGCPVGKSGVPVPIVQQGIVNSAFVTSSTTKSDLSTNAAGNFAGRVEQTTLAAHLRPNQQFGAITYIDSGGDSYYPPCRRRRAGGSRPDCSLVQPTPSESRLTINPWIRWAHPPGAGSARPPRALRPISATGATSARGQTSTAPKW